MKKQRNLERTIRLTSWVLLAFLLSAVSLYAQSTPTTSSKVNVGLALTSAISNRAKPAVGNEEVVDGTLAASSSVVNWISSSAPVPINFLNGGVSYVAGAVATNNRVRLRDNGAKYRENGSAENGGHLFAMTYNVNDRVQTMEIPYSALNNQRWAGVRTLLSKDGVDATGIKYLESWVCGDGKDNKWVVFDFGTISEDSAGDLPAGGARLVMPGHNPISTNINCDWHDLGVDEEGNPLNPGATGCDSGIKTYYMPGLFLGYPGVFSNAIPQGVQGFPDEAPSPEGMNNQQFDTKDMNGNGYIDTTNQYLSYGVRANWTGWKLVKIPIDSTQAEGFFTSTDDFSCFFHNQGGFGTGTSSPIVHAMRLWMTGTNTTDVDGDGDILVESIRLTGIATSGQILSHGLGVVLAPVPVHRGGDICLYPDERISGSKWDVYNVMGVSVKNLAFNSPYGDCWNTTGVAPGVYFVRLTLTYVDGKENKLWKKVVVIQ